MTGNEYQKHALRTANGMNYHTYDRIVNGVMGLTGEAGEVSDIVKKFLFQGHELDRDHVVEELGDCLWYIALTADAVGVDLDTVMQANVDKLKKRYPDGFSAEKSIHREEYTHAES